MNEHLRQPVLFITALVLLLTGCATTKITYERKNYTDEAIRTIEITRIEKTIPEHPVSALWHSKLILEANPHDAQAQKLYETAEDAVYTELLNAINTKKTIEIRRFYDSLATLSSSKLKDLAVAGETFNGFANSLQTDGSKTASGQPHKVSQMIRGTVTIWVDRGIKIERGMGYADRVIGSGFFIDRRGYIVTNYHVVSSEVDPKYEGFSRLYVRLADDPDTRIPAKVIGWDPELDLALLKTEVAAPYVFTLGSSDDLDIGDRIYAIGSPVGLEKTLTSGIVSATERKLFAMGDVMQIDAAINSGNSGGPIIDQNGAVQGIVFAGIKPYEGLNFAIPVEYLKIELDRLFHGGKVKHSWFGAYGRSKREIGSTPGSGVEIGYIMPGSASFISGLGTGDIITEFNGEAIASIEQLKTKLLSIQPETLVRLGGTTASGNTFEKIICLDERPEYPGYEIYQRDTLANATVPIFGMQMKSISDTSSKKYNIASIIRAGIADESGFSEMDYVEINKVRLSPDKDAMLIELYTKKRRSGYMDMFQSMAAPLDSPYYF